MSIHYNVTPRKIPQLEQFSTKKITHPLIHPNPQNSFPKPHPKISQKKKKKRTSQNQTFSTVAETPLRYHRALSTLTYSMRPSPLLDPETQKFADHLNAYISGETNDTYQAMVYYDYISMRKYLLESDQPLNNPVLTTLMPLLSRILNLDRYHTDYVEFLRHFLHLMPMKTSWVYFSKEEMLKTLQYPSPVKLYEATVDLVSWRIDAGDKDALDFLDNLSFLTKALQRCLSDHSISDRFWTMELLVLCCDEKLLDEIVSDLAHAVELVSLGSDCSLGARYMAITDKVIARRLDFPQTTYEKLTEVVQLDYLRETDPADLLFYGLVIQFYDELVPLLDKLHNLFLLLQPVLQCMLQVLAANWNNPEYKFTSDLGAFLGKLSYCKNEEVVSWLTDQKAFKSLVNDFAERDMTLLQIFGWINFGLIPDKRNFFNKHFAPIDLPNYFRLNVVRHAIEDPDFFRFFADSGKFSNSALAKLDSYSMYELIELLTRYQHSADYLLSEMPTVVQSYLVEVSDDVRNPRFLKHIRSSIGNLLENKDLDLGVWEKGLKSLLRALVNGRPREPQVDVQDQAF